MNRTYEICGRILNVSINVKWNFRRWGEKERIGEKIVEKMAEILANLVKKD